MQIIKGSYTPTTQQLELHYLAANHRFGVVVCHRRMGKTVWAVNTLVDAALRSTKQAARYAYIAPYYKQAKQVAWDYVKQYSSHIPNVRYNESDLSVDYPNGARLRLYGADNPDSLRGLYFDGLVLDEMADTKPDLWGKVLRPTLSDRKGWAYFLGTPKGIDSFYGLYERAQSDPTWFAALYRVTDTNMISDDELKAARAEMTDAQYAQEFLCDFSAVTDDTLIPIVLASEAAARNIHDTDVQGALRVLGVDVARYGGDSSVIMPVCGLKCYDPYVYKGINNIDLGEQIINKINMFRPDHVRIDAGGGAGVIDYIRSQGYTCTEVHFGSRNTPATYLNKRAQMWDGVRKWLEAGGSIPDNKDLISELCAVRYKIRSDNSMQLESKDDIRARGGRSPDLADALALAVGIPLKRRQVSVTNVSTGVTSSRIGNLSRGLRSGRR
jgi:hypothetical protein